MSKWLAIFIWIVPVTGMTQTLQVQQPVCEYQTNPVGIDITQPRLSWQLKAAAQNTLQTAYEIRVATTSTSLSKGNNIYPYDNKLANVK